MFLNLHETAKPESESAFRRQIRLARASDLTETLKPPVVIATANR